MISKLKRRLPDLKDDLLLQDLIEAAAGMICAYTGRESVPLQLEETQIEIACMIFNRMGMEGESAHSEGSVSHAVDSLPEFLRRAMNPFRLAKAVKA